MLDSLSSHLSACESRVQNLVKTQTMNSETFEGIVYYWEMAQKPKAIVFRLVGSRLVYCLLEKATTNFEKYIELIKSNPPEPLLVYVWADEKISDANYDLVLVRRVRLIPRITNTEIAMTLNTGEIIIIASEDKFISIPVTRQYSRLLKDDDDDKKKIDKLLENVCLSCLKFAMSDDSCLRCKRKLCQSCLKSHKCPK
jgi:hypothetical protein